MELASNNLNQLIDIDKLLKTKKPNLYKRLPSFIIRKIEKIACQDQCNDILMRFGHLDGADFIEAVFNDFNVEIVSHGVEDIPKNSRMVFAANHPLGGIDGLAVIYSVCKQFGAAKGVVNDLLLNVGSLKSVFCGVNVYGHNTPEIINNIDELYKSNFNICVFPAGMVSRRIDGEIKDLKWKKNFIVKSVQHNLPIVPVYVNAKNSDKFYSIANWRKKLGIKFNYELVMLPSEVFKYRDKPIELFFGKPIMPQTLNDIKNAEEKTQFVRQKVYAMAQTQKLKIV